MTSLGSLFQRPFEEGQGSVKVLLADLIGRLFDDTLHLLQPLCFLDLLLGDERHGGISTFCMFSWGVSNRHSSSFLAKPSFLKTTVYTPWGKPANLNSPRALVLKL